MQHQSKENEDDHQNLKKDDDIKAYHKTKLKDGDYISRKKHLSSSQESLKQGSCTRNVVLSEQIYWSVHFLSKLI